MVFQTGVRNPTHVLIASKPVCQSPCVVCVSLGTQTQSLQSQQELLRGEGVECGSHVAQDFHPHPDSKSKRSEGLPELQAVVTWGWLNKLWEACGVFAPIEFPAVNNDAADGGSVPPDPLGCAVDDYVGPVLDGTTEVTARPKRVVNLDIARTVVVSKAFHSITGSVPLAAVNLPPTGPPFHERPWQLPRNLVHYTEGFQSSRYRRPSCDHQWQRQCRLGHPPGQTWW